MFMWHPENFWRMIDVIFERRHLANSFRYVNSIVPSVIDMKICYDIFMMKSWNAVFSRRFMKWNATILSTFFNPDELTKIVLQVLRNFKESDWTIWHKKLKYKSWSFFQRNIQYRARLNGPHFILSALWDFFGKFLVSPKSSLSIFLIFCKKMYYKNYCKNYNIMDV